MPCTSLRGIFSHARNVKKYDALCGLLDRHLLASSNHRGTSSVATMAKAAVDHFGPTSCPVVSKLASTRKDRAEDACHQLLLTYIGIYHPCCKHMHLDYFLCVCVCVRVCFACRYMYGPAAQGFENTASSWTYRFRGSMWVSRTSSFLFCNPVTLFGLWLCMTKLVGW